MQVPGPTADLLNQGQSGAQETKACSSSDKGGRRGCLGGQGTRHTSAELQGQRTDQTKGGGTGLGLAGLRRNVMASGAEEEQEGTGLPTGPVGSGQQFGR